MRLGAVNRGRTQNELITAWSKMCQVDSAVTGLKVASALWKSESVAADEKPVAKAFGKGGPLHERAL